LIDKLSGKHFLLIGEFDYPGIDCVRQQCSSKCIWGWQTVFGIRGRGLH